MGVAAIGGKFEIRNVVGRSLFTANRDMTVAAPRIGL